MYVTTVLFQLIAWYLDNVLPQEYGTPLKWNFPCQRKYWKKAETVGASSTRHILIGTSDLSISSTMTATVMRGVLKATVKLGRVLAHVRANAETAAGDVVEPLDPDTAAVAESGRALVIKHLRKEFPSDVPGKRFVAVDGIDMTMAEVLDAGFSYCTLSLEVIVWFLLFFFLQGQIFVLLGHNGYVKAVSIDPVCIL